MTNPLAAVGLTFVNGRGLAGDLQPLDLGWFFEIIEGLDGSAPVREASAVLPFRHGRLALEEFSDSRPIALQGLVQDTEASPLVGYRANFDALLLLFDPTAGVGRLTATLEDGTTRFVFCRSTGLIPGSQDARGLRKAAVQLSAADPNWYASPVIPTWDPVGRSWDQGYIWEDTADFVITPTSTYHRLNLPSLSALQVDQIRIAFDGPSAGAGPYPNVGIEYLAPIGSPVGFIMSAQPKLYTPGGAAVAGTYPYAMLSTEQWIFDNLSRKSAVYHSGALVPAGFTNGPTAPLTAWMTRSAGNVGGEFFHLPPGAPAALVIYGWPTQVRLQWNTTYP